MYTAIFVAICILVPILFLAGTKGLVKLVSIYLCWNIAVGLLSYSGFFTDTQSLPPRMALVVIPAVIFVLACIRHRGNVQIKLGYHLALHSLRLPIELILYGIYLKGLLPQLMTYKGWNWDITSGTSAIILLLVSVSGRPIPKKFFRYWNLACLLLLAIVVTIAILSAPSPIQLIARESPNVAVLQFPYTLLPSLIVPLVCLSHLIMLKGINMGK